MSILSDNGQESGRLEMRLGGEAFGAVLRHAQTVSLALETLNRLTSGGDGAGLAADRLVVETVEMGRGAMADLIGLVRAGIQRPQEWLEAQEDETVDSGQRRPVRGRVVEGAPGIWP